MWKSSTETVLVLEAAQLESIFHLQHFICGLLSFQSFGPMFGGQGDLMRQTFEAGGIGEVANLEDALILILSRKLVLAETI